MNHADPYRRPGRHSCSGRQLHEGSGDGPPLHHRKRSGERKGRVYHSRLRRCTCLLPPSPLSPPPSPSDRSAERSNYLQLWDVCSDQEAVDLVRHIHDPQEASKKLVDHALSQFSSDNLSCMIVRLDPTGKFEGIKAQQLLDRRDDPAATAAAAAQGGGSAKGTETAAVKTEATTAATAASPAKEKVEKDGAEG